jgi:hypothetical protein
VTQGSYPENENIVLSLFAIYWTGLDKATQSLPKLLGYRGVSPIDEKPSIDGDLSLSTRNGKLSDCMPDSKYPFRLVAIVPLDNWSLTRHRISCVLAPHKSSRLVS